MRLKKLPILKRTFLGYNASGEERYDFLPAGHMIGKVSFSSSSEEWNETRNSNETTIKVYCEKKAEVSSGDRFEYSGNIWLIEGVPEFWENNIGYRNVFVVTGKVVIG